MSRIAIAATLFAAAGLLPAAPLLAQEAGERVNQLIVYGDDPCPPSESADEITVCARKDESERFRIPEELRDSTSPQNIAWTDRVRAYETIGKTGTLSCSPVGAGGWTGCAQQLITQAYAERENAPEVRFSELIAAERERRLSTLDEEARESQARVEAAEREYEARQAAAQSQASDTP